MAVGLREHLKNDPDHVHRTTYYVEPNLVQISNFTLSTRRNGQIRNFKIQDAGCRHFGFLGYVK